MTETKGIAMTSEGPLGKTAKDFFDSRGRIALQKQISLLFFGFYLP
jgi:hypothetical protein